MSQAISDAVQAALNTFIGAPTRHNRERLLDAADEYRELWVEAQAGKGAVETPAAPSRKQATSYDRALEVMEVVDGIPVKLALQERTSPMWESPWWTLSWRTKYSLDGSNRRFYLTKDGCWTIPAETALSMIRQMDALGGLGDRYLDPRGAPRFATMVSTQLSSEQRAKELAMLTAPDEDWGEDPFFVIAFDPHPSWKKVMIINRESHTATFRSITEDSDYMPRKVLRPNEGWWLDNSMMDANVQQMAAFQKYLSEYLQAH